MIEKKVDEYAKKMGYERAFYRLKWKGYNVYEPVYTDELSYIGLPLMILEKDGKFRMTDVDESFEILDITADMDEKIERGSILDDKYTSKVEYTKDSDLSFIEKLKSFFGKGFKSSRQKDLVEDWDKESLVDRVKGKFFIWHTDKINKYDKAAIDSTREKSLRAVNGYLVDKENKKAVLYHGTKKIFEKFEKGDIGFHFGSKKQAEEKAYINGRIIMANLKVNNILYLKDMGDFSPTDNLVDYLYRVKAINKEQFENIKNTGREIGDEYNNSFDSHRSRKIRDAIIDNGYDCIAYENSKEGIKNSVGDVSYIVFSNEQIEQIGG